MEREVGGGIGMGNTCKPMAVSFQCMTKSTTIKKKKKNLEDARFSIHYFKNYQIKEKNLEFILPILVRTVLQNYQIIIMEKYGFTEIFL